jgi:hypothetical protein
MKRLALVTALLVAWPAWADRDGDVFRTRLIGYEEVPSVSTAASGQFTARVSRDGQSVDFVLSYSGLQGAVRQAHIHFAQESVNGPIIIWLCGTPTNPGPTGTRTCPQSGTVTGTFTAADVLPSPPAQQLGAGELQELIAAMRAGAAYSNVHSDISPGGEIRGQIGDEGPGSRHDH